MESGVNGQLVLVWVLYSWWSGKWHHCTVMATTADVSNQRVVTAVRVSQVPSSGCRSRRHLRAETWPCEVWVRRGLIDDAHHRQVGQHCDRNNSLSAVLVEARKEAWARRARWNGAAPNHTDTSVCVLFALFGSPRTRTHPQGGGWNRCKPFSNHRRFCPLTRCPCQVTRERDQAVLPILFNSNYLVRFDSDVKYRFGARAYI